MQLCLKQNTGTLMVGDLKHESLSAVSLENFICVLVEVEDRLLISF